MAFVTGEPSSAPTGCRDGVLAVLQMDTSDDVPLLDTPEYEVLTMK